MFVTKKSLPRRTFLQGMGVVMGLPLLEAMVPALTAAAQTAARPNYRFGAIYVPHGVIMDQWTPSAAGSGFELTQILAPLAPFRDSLVVVSNLTRAEVNSNHAVSSACWLTGVPPPPNMRSNTTRGLISIGSGDVGDCQFKVFMYAQL